MDFNSNSPPHAETILDVISKVNYSKGDLCYLLEGIRKVLKQRTSSEESENSDSSAGNNSIVSSVLSNKSKKRKQFASDNSSPNQRNTKKIKNKSPQTGVLNANLAQILNSMQQPEISHVAPQQQLTTASLEKSVSQQTNNNSQVNALTTSQINDFYANQRPGPSRSADNIPLDQSINNKPRKTNNPNLIKGKKLKINDNVSKPNSQQPRDNTKPPHIIIRSQQDWGNTRELLKNNNIDYKIIRCTGEGVKIQTSSLPQYRLTLHLLEQNNKGYHTFLPVEERDLHVVIRGTGMALSVDEARQDLILQGFKPNKVMRMRHPRTRYDMPLILVTLPREGNSKEIFNILTLCEIVVTVEPLKQSPVVGQCMRCLLFGHSTAQCHAPFRCKHCAGKHSSNECSIKATGPYKCSNCRGGHRATYRGCDRAPKQRPLGNEQLNQNSEKATQGMKKIASDGYKNTINEKSYPKLPNRNLNQNQNAQSTAENKKQNKTTMAQVVKRSTLLENAGPNQQDIITTFHQLSQLKEAIFSLAEMFNSLALSLKKLN